MKVLFLSFVVGLGVGALYGLIRVKSPAPPIVALLGLLGMVLGEQLGIGFIQKMSMFPVLRPSALSVSIGISERDVQSVLSVRPHADRKAFSSAEFVVERNPVIDLSI